MIGTQRKSAQVVSGTLWQHACVRLTKDFVPPALPNDPRYPPPATLVVPMVTDATSGWRQSYRGWLRRVLEEEGFESCGYLAGCVISRFHKLDGIDYALLQGALMPEVQALLGPQAGTAAAIPKPPPTGQGPTTGTGPGKWQAKPGDWHDKPGEEQYWPPPEEPSPEPPSEGAAAPEDSGFPGIEIPEQSPPSPPVPSPGPSGPMPPFAPLDVFVPKPAAPTPSQWQVPRSGYVTVGVLVGLTAAAAAAAWYFGRNT